MADDEETFVPHSDEDLARLLEEQMVQLRAETAEVQPIPRDAEMDAIFSALLDEQEPETVVKPVTADFKPAVDEDSLAQTVPIDIVPIPSMFTESSSEAAYIAAALAPEVVEAVAMVAVTETVIDHVFEDGTVEETIIEDVTVDGELVEETVIEQIFEQVSDTNVTNPVTTFERRPSFDELVFGASTED